MTSRGRAALVIGLTAFLAARLFGSQPLYPVAFGLVLAVGLGWLWVRLASGPGRLGRLVPAGSRFEGDDVGIDVRLELAGIVPPPSVTLVERVGKAGEVTAALSRWSGFLAGGYLLPGLRRGRYVFEGSRVVIEDPFGFARTEVNVPAPAALLVYPRLVTVERLFVDGSPAATDGRRLVLQRPSGFDLHSVREYEHGESLRRVHWPSTAKRGELMVKELEDAPRDEVAVVLDADARFVAGESFDAQVRAAGSVLDAHVARGRRCVLMVNGAEREVQRVHSQGDRRRALDLLAAVEPDGRTSLAALLRDETGAPGLAAELTVVTASPAPELAEVLMRRAAGRRRAAVVFVDAPTFAPGSANRVPNPQLLRLQSAGVPVAVLRAGDDLQAVLSAAGSAAVAGG
ncbi:MAG: DUF58 domain-containing protein [Actinomycetota bacterium]|nr:DUF58 domain-containing protein [Actinomycetota bacterium]